jgi:SAM-dependent methyltransferase
MKVAANQDQFDSWNGESGTRWTADADRRDQVLAPVAEALLAAAAIGPGDDVLDLGCGCGATTLHAAAAATPGGAAFGIDLSAPMLERARRRGAGLERVEFVQGDAQTHPFAPSSFDVAISRFGTMFFADPVAAFSNVHRALRPGGRLCLATWRPLGDNPWLVLPGAALLGHVASLPSGEDGPGMFAQSDPAVVSELLTVAGYRDVSLDAVDVTFTLGATIDEAVDYLADTGPARRVLDDIPGDRRDAALADVRGVLADHIDGRGVRLGGGIWIIQAAR